MELLTTISTEQIVITTASGMAMGGWMRSWPAGVAAAGLGFCFPLYAKLLLALALAVFAYRKMSKRDKTVQNDNKRWRDIDIVDAEFTVVSEKTA